MCEEKTKLKLLVCVGHDDDTMIDFTEKIDRKNIENIVVQVEFEFIIMNEKEKETTFITDQ